MTSPLCLERVTTRALAALLLAGVLAAPARAVTFSVSKTADTNDGACNADCSLREAIVAANTAAGSDTITFAVAGTFSITGTTLPSITSPLVINGTSAPGWTSTPVVRIDGVGLASGNGLTFAAGASASSVYGVAITRFPGNGILIQTSSTAVTRSYVGVALDGSTDAGNGLAGVVVSALNCVVGNTSVGNVISGNGGYGIQVLSGSDSLQIRDNRIGTNAAGTAALPNDLGGILGSGSASVGVGGTLAGQGNVISGNGGIGIELAGSSNHWTIAGNNVGVNAAGTAALGNAGGGISAASSSHTIGGVSAVARNVVSANLNYGILVGSAADAVLIVGNFIGTNAAGTAALTGQPYGILVQGTNCTIGSVTGTGRNVISGNSWSGISIEGTASGCVVIANYLGLDAAGGAAVPNGGGVSVDGNANTVGGVLAVDRNVISGNAADGVVLRGTNNKVLGNYIGTNAAGAAAVPNGGNGIRVIGATSGAIGGLNPGEGNVLSGNVANGISFDSDTSGLTVQGNLIGVDAAGVVALGNAGGVQLAGSGHTVGGAVAAARNVISGNPQGGVAVSGTGHVIRGNYIGTNVTGSAAITGSTAHGIRVLVASGITIGGSAAGEGNLISGNGAAGIGTDGASSTVTIQGNKIGTNAAGSAAVANGGGVSLGGSGHLLGGGSAGARNLISGNLGSGVALTGSQLVVRGNYIGVNGAGTAALGNGSFGLRGYGEIDCEIGGPAAADGNVIAGNGRSVSFEQGATGNRMRNNIVGLDATGTVDLADSGTGIELGSPGNTIGAPGAGNVIAGFPYHGIAITGAVATGNVIQGNWIGTNAALAGGLGNYQIGIYVDTASGNTIGGLGAGEGNVVANSGFLGIWVEHGERNEISGNSIFGSALLGIDVGEQGVAPNDSGDADVGGNRSQNYPLIAAAMVSGATTSVQGRLNNEPNTQYRVELFSSPTCGATGFGEGRTYRGATLVTTDAVGLGTLSTVLPLAVPDPFLTATVTDPLGNTSELSPCVAIGGANPGKLQFYRNAVLAYEGNLPTGDAVVTRSHGLSGTVSVTFTSSDNTAVAGQDYTDSDQTLTFAPWEVVKVVKIPILFDPAPEPSPEFADLALSAPSGGATLGVASSLLYIFDNDPAYPGITIDDAAVVEGDSGQTLMTFNVHLSPSNHAVTVTYFTGQGTATPGQDFQSSDGTLSFGASGSVQTLPVQVAVWGDTDVEADEVLWLTITTAPGGGNWVAYDTVAAGKILNDDSGTPPPPGAIFADTFEVGSTGRWSDATP